MSEMITIPGFEIIEKIGAGGMATVWKARQISLDRVVAIKILHPSFAIHDEDVQRFQGEAQSAAKLKHPGIVQVYDANAVEGLYFFVMEYISGYTVGSWAKRKGCLDEKDAMVVVECIAEALQYAWDNQGIIHCDIKPDNILIDADGTVKISDLGLARTISGMTRTEEDSDEIMGTPCYISPEQAQGLPDLDFRSDIYSLGATLYHLLTGKIPFEGETSERIMELQVTGTLEPVTEVNPDVSRPAGMLVERMMAKDPDLRQSSWGQVLDDIANVKEGRKPGGAALAEASSTVRHIDYDEADDAPVDTSRLPAYLRDRPLKAAGVVVGLFLVVIFTRPGTRDNEQANTPVPDPVEESSVAGTPPAEAESGQPDVLQQQFDDAMAWSAAHPGQFDASIDRFESILKVAGDSPLSQRVKAEIAELRQARTQAMQSVMSSLETRASKRVEAGEFERAASVYENYDGNLAAATRPDRLARATEIRQQIPAAPVDAPEPAVPAMAADYDSILDEISDHLVNRRTDKAMQACSGPMKQMTPGGDLRKLEQIQKVLSEGLSLNRQILDSFSEQLGHTVDVRLASGEVRRVDIVGVGDRAVRVTAGGQAAGVKPPVSMLTLDELAYEEKLLRLRADRGPGAALLKGLMALEAGSSVYARKYFAETHPDLSARLVARLDGDS